MDISQFMLISLISFVKFGVISTHDHKKEAVPKEQNGNPPHQGRRTLKGMKWSQSRKLRKSAKKKDNVLTRLAGARKDGIMCREALARGESIIEGFGLMYAKDCRSEDVGVDIVNPGEG